jgi:hypothetical protein
MAYNLKGHFNCLLCETVKPHLRQYFLKTESIGQALIVALVEPVTYLSIRVKNSNYLGNIIVFVSNKAKMLSKLPLNINIRKVATKTNIINVHSFDFHDCLFNKQWFEMMKDYKNRPYDVSFLRDQEFALFKSNINIINWVKDTAHSTHANKVIFMLGSACQSYIDDRRHRLNGIRDIPQASVFSGLKILYNNIAKDLNYKNINIELDYFTLADVFDDLVPGTSFRLALETAENTSKKIHHANWVLDDAKITILYSQIHKISSSAHDAKIIYHFYDDKKKILDNLFDFFNSNIDLIPSNTTLNLIQYNGEVSKVIKQLTGIGTSDKDYNHSIKKMVELCGYEHDFISITNLIKSLNSRRISLFKCWLSNRLGYKNDTNAISAAISHPSVEQFFSRISIFKAPISRKNTMKAIAIDFDKCVYTESYTNRMTKERSNDLEMSWGDFLELQNEILISENVNLFNHLSNEAKDIDYPDKIQLLLASARQSFMSDTINMIHGRDINGSAFQGLLMFRNRMEYEMHKLNKKNMSIEINYLLLADLYADLEHGKSFRLALSQMHNESRNWKSNCIELLPKNNFNGHANWIFDDSKITIVYAHIQMLAFENPMTNITYDFYDDRMDILENIHDFFVKNLDLIPLGLTISLNQYCGGDIRKIALLIGNGRIDQTYDKSIKKLVELSGHDKSNYFEIINIIKLLQINDRITQFKQWRESDSSLEVVYSL